MKRAELEHVIRTAAGFLRAVARHALVDRTTLLARAAATDLVPEVRALVVGRITEAFPG